MPKWEVRGVVLRDAEQSKEVTAQETETAQKLCKAKTIAGSLSMGAWWGEHQGQRDGKLRRKTDPHNLLPTSSSPSVLFFCFLIS